MLVARGDSPEGSLLIVALTDQDWQDMRNGFTKTKDGMGGQFGFGQMIVCHGGETDADAAALLDKATKSGLSQAIQRDDAIHHSLKTTPFFKDIADMEEDERIGYIGKHAMDKKVAFVVDDEPGKAERYIEKLTARFPELRVMGRGTGPVARTITLTVGRKK